MRFGRAIAKSGKGDLMVLEEDLAGWRGGLRGVQFLRLGRGDVKTGNYGLGVGDVMVGNRKT